MPDQPNPLPTRGERRSQAHIFSDAPRSTPQIVPEPAQPRFTVAGHYQPPSIAVNPLFPPPESYQLAPGEQPTSRVSRPNASGALGFTSSLDLTLQGFANVPSGQYANVATYLRSNPSILRQDPSFLLREAIQAHRYASRGREVQHTNKSLYGDSCLQQYVILRQLKVLQQRHEERLQRRATNEERAEVIQRYFDQLLDNASPTRKRLYEELDEARAHARRQLQDAGPGLQATQLSPTSPNSRNVNATGLDSRYVVRPSSYYQPGRVFAILWHEPYNESQGNGSRPTYLSDNVSVGRFGERIYSSIRRMVVVRQDHGCCVCIQINTYGKRGLGKFLSSPKDVEAHSIIYMDDTHPQPQQGEPRSSKRAIAVRKSSPEQKLNPWSRLCYSQPNTVQHTAKALDVGFVTKDSLPYLLSYFQLVNSLAKET